MKAVSPSFGVSVCLVAVVIARFLMFVIVLVASQSANLKTLENTKSPKTSHPFCSHLSCLVFGVWCFVSLLFCFLVVFSSLCYCCYCCCFVTPSPLFFILPLNHKTTKTFQNTKSPKKPRLVSLVLALGPCHGFPPHVFLLTPLTLVSCFHILSCVSF